MEYNVSIFQTDLDLVDRSSFVHRHNLFTRGIFDDLYDCGMILSGGSLYAMLDKSISDNDLENMDSDIDMFLCATDNFPKVIERILTTIQLERPDAVFVLRGLLLEIMIPNVRRIQLLCTMYKSIADCINSVDFSHLHMYYDGRDVWTNQVTVDSLGQKKTFACRAPIKDSRLDKILARCKDLSGDGTFLVTRMDDRFYQTLQRLDELKTCIDNGLPWPTFDVPGFTVTTEVQCAVDHTLQLCKVKWSAERRKMLQQLGVRQDIDIIDVNIRLPVDGHVMDALVWKRGHDGNGDVEVLFLNAQDTGKFPAIFATRLQGLKETAVLENFLVHFGTNYSMVTSSLFTCVFDENGTLTNSVSDKPYMVSFFVLRAGKTLTLLINEMNRVE